MIMILHGSTLIRAESTFCEHLFQVIIHVLASQPIAELDGLYGRMDDITEPLNIIGKLVCWSQCAALNSLDPLMGNIISLLGFERKPKYSRILTSK